MFSLKLLSYIFLHFFSKIFTPIQNLGEEPEQSHGSEIDSLVLLKILAMYSTAFSQVQIDFCIDFTMKY